MSEPIANLSRAGWPAPASLLVRARLALLLSLVALTAAAWAITIYFAAGMDMPMGIGSAGGGLHEGMPGMAGMAMGGMSAGGWALQDAALFLLVWTIMMAAMMLPAAAPMILIFASAQGRRSRAAAVPTWIFVSGYILVWAGVGVAVYILVQLGSEVAGRIGAADRAMWAPLALGATLIVAGIYQFTPAKRVCLSHCRSPFAFVAQHWRDGRLGALGMGLRHGAWCLGCCWALFAVLVAAGVMSMAWMLLLTLVVFVEKVTPQGGRLARLVGAALVILGSLIGAGAVPIGIFA